jgi:hypothetical protein
MLKIDRKSQTFQHLPDIPLSQANVQERYDLQEWIVNSSKVFFQEIGEDFLVVGKEVRPSDECGDRIDVLAIDSDGSAVVIELKRDNSKLHLLQALSYAAMIGSWDRSDFENVVGDSRKEELDRFLGGIDDDLNKSQRVLLIAESFDYEVLVTAEWLANKFGVNIACYRISLVSDAFCASEYLSCVQIFPPKEIAAEVIRRGAANVASVNQTRSLTERLDLCKNPAVVEFTKARLSQKQRLNYRKNTLVYPQEGKMRWRVRVRASYAGVLQLGRFEGDEKLWSGGLSDANVHVRSNNQLSFRLKTAMDFSLFQRTMDEEASKFQWKSSDSADDLDEQDDE